MASAEVDERNGNRTGVRYIKQFVAYRDEKRFGQLMSYFVTIGQDKLAFQQGVSGGL